MSTAIQMMSATAELFVQNVVQQNWLAAYSNLARIPYLELFRVLAFIDRSDLKDLACHKQDSGASALSNDAEKLAHIDYALQTVLKGKKPVVPKRADQFKTFVPAARGVHGQFETDFVAAANDYLHNVVMLRRIPVGISYDATATLPSGSANPASLTDADFRDAAQNLKVEVAAIKAVTLVESPKGGFQDGKRPTLRYELHVFQSRTNGQFHLTHPWLSEPTLKAGNPYHKGDESQDQEYSLLYNAMLMGGANNRQIDTALSSASYGRFQIMGFNYDSVGWPSVRSFVQSMFVSESEQLKAFIEFIRANRLQKSIQEKDWAGFASRYNGPGYADNAYDTKMEKFYNALKGAEDKVAPKAVDRKPQPVAQ